MTWHGSHTTKINTWKSKILELWLIWVLLGPWEETSLLKMHSCTFLHSLGRSSKKEQRKVFQPTASFGVKGGLSTPKIEFFPTSTSCWQEVWTLQFLTVKGCDSWDFFQTTKMKSWVMKLKGVSNNCWNIASI